MKKYFEYLEKNFPLESGEISMESVSKLSPNQIIDSAKVLTSLITDSEPKNSNSIFNHCASITLSGGRGSCWAYPCREKQLNQLARIAALYSDKIYINNYFSYFDSHLTDDEYIHEYFYDDLSLIYQIRPLVESGIVSIVREVPEYCPCCTAGAIAGDHKDTDRINLINESVSSIANEYYKKSSIYLELDEDNMLGFSIKAPYPYFPHGSQYIEARELPAFLQGNNELLTKLEKDGRIKLDKNTQKNLGFHKNTAEEIKQQIFYETYVNNILNTTYLTESAIHIKFLQQISKNPKIIRRNSIIANNLTTLVPFAEDVPIDKLLSLRKREEESFVQFRKSINAAISETTNLENRLDASRAREIYSDIIYPNLIKLEQKVKEAKKDLVKTTYRSIIGVVGAISFGIYTGLLPNEITAIAKALGFGKVSSDLINKFMSLGDAKSAIKTDDLYFLWEIKKHAEKRKRH